MLVSLKSLLDEAVKIIITCKRDWQTNSDYSDLGIYQTFSKMGEKNLPLQRKKLMAFVAND